MAYHQLIGLLSRRRRCRLSGTDPVIWTRRSSAAHRSCLINAIRIPRGSSQTGLATSSHYLVLQIYPDTDSPASDAFLLAEGLVVLRGELSHCPAGCVKLNHDVRGCLVTWPAGS